MALFIPETQARFLAEVAGRALPHECLGLLLGSREAGHGYLSECFPLTNVHPGCRRTNVLCHPLDYLRGERRAEELGLEICGFYHSHPDQPALPSNTDLVSAAFSDWSHLIVSVSGSGDYHLRSWVLNPKRTAFEEEKIVIQGGCYA